MFETSQDILNWAKTFAVVGLSLIFGFLLFYITMTFRTLFKAIKEVREKINKIDEILKLLKKKLEHTSSYLFLLAEGMKKLVEVAKDYNSKKSDEKNNTKNSK